MRRLLLILLSLVILLFIAGGIVFGLKTPEMPIKEVHKVIAPPKIQQQANAPEVPDIPKAPPIIIPYHNNQQGGTASTPAVQSNPQPVAPPTLPEPGKVPGNAVGSGTAH